MPLDDNEVIGSLETANGLMLCTEYLGFESYDMKMSQNEVEKEMTCHAEEETERVERKRRKMATEEHKNVVAPVREGKRVFPPPLSSLNGRGGQRSFYLQPVRRDGRLELARVMIDRPEIFHASRENGRLRLHLVNGTPRKGLQGELSVDNNGDQKVDLSMINDDTSAGSLTYKSKEEGSLNSDDDDAAHFEDQNDAREWKYKNCYTSGNHDQKDHHHHRHNFHPYHHYGSNNNMHLWSRSYVKTR